jgi:hypothetical protein
MGTTSTKIPGWFVVIVVAVTAVVTAWAMLKRDGGDLLYQTTTYPRQVTQVLYPATGAMSQGMGQGAQQVAANRSPPPIHAGIMPTHGERGPCTLCHKVVDALGRTLPAIRVMASMPHQYRGGLCINCHHVSRNQAGSPAAGGGRAAALGAGGRSPVAGQLPAAAVRKPPPSEGAWQGMEVVPITSMTASQYGLRPGTTGLVVAEAEGAAGAAGVQAGDVVVRVNSTPVTDMRAFIGATQNGSAPAGQVTITRDGKLHRIALGGASGQSPGTTPRPAAGGAGGAPAAGTQGFGLVGGSALMQRQGATSAPTGTGLAQPSTPPCRTAR